MLKREIKYEDYDGNVVTEVFYFNISKPEMIEWEVEHPEGFTKWIERVIEAKDNKTLIQQFKKIILMAYGERSDDGRRFIKTDENKAEFAQTAAYISLFTELSENSDAAANFMLGVVPRDMVGEVEKNISTPPMPPTPSS